jgi:hypothetical protein
MTRSDTTAAVSQEWSEFLSALQHAGKVVFADQRVDSELAEAEAGRYLTRLINLATMFMLENADPRCPHFTKPESPYLQWAMPNSDYVYWQAPVHGDYTYRVWGKRGTAQMFAVEVYTGQYSDLAEQTVLDSKAHCTDGSGDLEVNPDGSFEVIVSRDQQPGNWLRLPEGHAGILLRDAYYDWDTETPSEFYIERIGAQYPLAPLTGEQINEQLQKVTKFVRETPPLYIQAVDMHYAIPPDRMAFPDMTEAGCSNLYFANQYYGRGHFRCGPDEAVIVEARPPKCFYWNFQVGFDNWEAGDWHQRQTSINGHQAVLDDDGVFRAVVAHSDPGVPNWLDPAGHHHGLLLCRYNRPESIPEEPSVRTVPLVSVRDHLPSSTPAMSSAERSASVRRRILSVPRRSAD